LREQAGKSNPKDQEHGNDSQDNKQWAFHFLFSFMIVR
jgi:hypothetical protein